MRITIPSELTDHRTRGFILLPRGDQLEYMEMMLRVEALKDEFRTQHADTCAKDDFRFDGSDLVSASDHSPRPAYDVKVLWSFAKNAQELEDQRLSREAYVSQREADYRKREEEQKALLESVIQDIQERIHRT